MKSGSDGRAHEPATAAVACGALILHDAEHASLVALFGVTLHFAAGAIELEGSDTALHQSRIAMRALLWGSGAA